MLGPAEANMYGLLAQQCCSCLCLACFTSLHGNSENMQEAPWHLCLPVLLQYMVGVCPYLHSQQHAGKAYKAQTAVLVDAQSTDRCHASRLAHAQRHISEARYMLRDVQSQSRHFKLCRCCSQCGCSAPTPSAHDLGQTQMPCNLPAKGGGAGGRAVCGPMTCLNRTADFCSPVIRSCMLPDVPTLQSYSWCKY